MELIDFDGLFDEKLAEYMQQNRGKYTEKQWEALIPKLYKQFGDTFIPKAGATPKGYYAAMTDEALVEALVRHIEEGVPVSDFLCRELEGRDCPDALLTLLQETDSELITLAVNLIGSHPKAFGPYFRLLALPDCDEDVAETICEQLKMSADRVKALALEDYKKDIRSEMMLEILSRCKERDDAVFEVLLNAFRTSGEELPMRASYLAAYGDVRALPTLLEAIDRDDINFLEYQELKYAIEALGGEYTRPRDFTNDAYFQEIASQQAGALDILASNNKKSDA